ncbi:hypothetical protein NLU13_6744 [Sarocladium strictum]|uniref:Zn(2)-C6 fungal-type domain-containing protein n=1 Tax=Sarocladium strictum TaxID=5046 RepID=A0AA39L6B0_SARSR|nr:hypothetical protein NLU13_6744 [Sarocladium strictum]
MSPDEPAESTSPPPQAGTKKTRPRGSRACVVCRRRKVRCNVALVGTPCSNCAIDHETCSIPEKSQRKWSRRRRASNVTPMPTLDEQAAQNTDPHAAEPVKTAINSAVPRPETVDTSIATTRAPSPQAAHHRSGRQTPILEQSWDQGGQDSWHQHRPIERPFAATVPMSAYPFLTLSNLHRLPAEDVNFLELKECLRVPRRAHLDEFLHQYFRYVHPFFPLINEAFFWDVYHGADLVADNPLPRFPLLVLQAMLFTACSFVSPDTLRQMGYGSVRAARRVMYERAKMLYHLNAESSRLYLAQAALLLSYWTPAFEETAVKPNAGWLRAAVENARSVRAHRWHTSGKLGKAPIEDYQHISLKRLWACCIFRGGTLAISSRRCCQGLGLDSDVNQHGFPLTAEDLEDEVDESIVYDPDTKRRLITACLGLGEICMHVVATSTVLFPFDSGQHDATTRLQHEQGEEVIRVMTCKLTLDEAHKRAIRPFSDLARPEDTSTTDGRTQHPSVTLFEHLRDIYYYSAKIALANRQMLSCHDTYPTRTGEMEALYAEIQDATSAISRHLKILTELRLARFLPVSVVPCIALPLALHTANSRKTAPNLENPVFAEVLKTYSHLYDGVEGLTKTVRTIVNQVLLNYTVETSRQVVDNTFDSSGHTGNNSAQPLGYYMRLALSLDLSISTGNLPDETDFPARVEEHLSTSPESVDRAGADSSPANDEVVAMPATYNAQIPIQLEDMRYDIPVEQWSFPNEQAMTAQIATANQNPWDMEDLSARTMEHRILESLIWSSPKLN